MSMTTPIVDFVRSYAQSGTARLHMPGHKGQSLLGFEPWDITEIKGADELYGADGIIAESEANATRLFGTAHSYYSTEGSSQCIRAMLCLALQAAPAAGQRPVLLAARNAHKALLYAAALLDFDIQWLWPAPQDAGALCSCPVSAAKLTGALQGLAQQGKRPFGVYITSPDYLGGVQDIAALAEVCGILAFRFWWIMPTVLTCVFCRRAVSIPLHWARPCAATPAIKRCPLSLAAHTCIWAKMPPFRTKPLCAMHWRCLVPPVRLT